MQKLPELQDFRGTSTQDSKGFGTAGVQTCMASSSPHPVASGRQPFFFNNVLKQFGGASTTCLLLRIFFLVFVSAYVAASTYEGVKGSFPATLWSLLHVSSQPYPRMQTR
ncbi:hypothetical protein R1flu_008476 [Riccia fluitans]|uniref:CASP-like protein n=1 Tax=Riccia fluitans TaxID=41844 RepID=A0ABD1YBS4_9MARC